MCKGGQCGCARGEVGQADAPSKHPRPLDEPPPFHPPLNSLRFPVLRRGEFDMVEGTGLGQAPKRAREEEEAHFQQERGVSGDITSQRVSFGMCACAGTSKSAPPPGCTCTLPRNPTLTLPYPTHLISPHLTSPHLISSHLISSHGLRRRSSKVGSRNISTKRTLTVHVSGAHRMKIRQGRRRVRRRSRPRSATRL